MSTYADAYSRYLSNNFNYINKYKTFRKYFRNSIISITDPNFMSKALISNKNSFPKYPYFFNAFARTDSINLVKIYNSTMDNTGNLMESMVGSSELAKKEFYDTIPSSLDNFLTEINFQFAYTSTPTDLYDYELIVKSFVNEYQYRNFFSDLYAPLFHSVDQIDGETAGLESNNFLYEYILYCTLYNTITISHDIYPKSLMYLTYLNSGGAAPSDRVDQQAMLDGFSSFVTNYTDTISTDLSVVIGKSIYDFQNISKTMVKDLSEIIYDEVANISTVITGGTATFSASTSVVCSNITIYESIPVESVIYNSTNDTITNAVRVISVSDGPTHTGPYTLTLDSAYTGTFGASKEVSILSGLYASFYTFYKPLVSLGPVNFLTNNVIQQLNALIAADLVTKTYTDSDIIDQDIMTIKTQEEDDSYSVFMGKISESELKNYLFLCFLYKFWPIKFLNVMQLSIKEYVENIIKTVDDDTTTQNEYAGIFQYFVNNYITSYPNLKTFLDGYISPLASIVTTGLGSNAKFTFTPGTTFITCSDADSYNAVNVHDYIYAEGDDRDISSAHIMSKILGTLTLVIDKEYSGTAGSDVNAYRYSFSSSGNYFEYVTSTSNVAELACVLYYIFILEEFFNSNAYNDFIENLSEKIFTELRNNGHIDYTFDWYQYHDIIDIYFKVFLRWKLFDVSKRCTLPTHINGRYRFVNGEQKVYCIGIDSYNLISDNDFIFSEVDTYDNAAQVTSHQIIGSEYVLDLSSPYSGTTTLTGTNNIAYYFKSTDSLLFDNVTHNFAHLLFPKLITNTSPFPDYDINTSIPSAGTLEEYFKAYSNSSSFARSMNQFNENMMVSTLTREMIYSVLSEFV